MSIEVIVEKCKGCTLCVKKCPYGAITMIDDIAVINYDKCTLCGACVEACKFDAIVMDVKEVEKKDLSAYKGVWVYAEKLDEEINSVTYELLGEGRKLADKLKVELSAVLFGNNVNWYLK